MDIDIQKYINILTHCQTIRKNGRVTQIIGLTVESQGPETKIGDLCYIYPIDKSSQPIPSEVVGFKENKVLLMPLGELTSIAPGSEVVSTGNPLSVKVGTELLGKVLDGLGNPLDGSRLYCSHNYSTNTPPTNPLLRPRVSEPISLGVRAIDGLLTMGKGQRIGIFAGSGVGKSTLLGMIARNTLADVNVICLVGERNREVRDFIEKDLGEEGLKRSVLVVATSDQPALVRLKSAMVATSIAEYFRNCGKNVMLMMDSVTRFAMAQREIGLAIGEPPATKGYTPSVFSMLPKLLERAGNSNKGSISALYTVLVDGGDMDDPIADTVRGILDGHIILDRGLAQKGQYPAIDILASVSRTMNDICNFMHVQAANNLRANLALFRENEELINIGAYKKGTNSELDRAIRYKDIIHRYISQGTEEFVNLEQSVNALITNFGGN